MLLHPPLKEAVPIRYYPGLCSRAVPLCRGCAPVVEWTPTAHLVADTRAGSPPQETGQATTTAANGHTTGSSPPTIVLQKMKSGGDMWSSRKEKTAAKATARGRLAQALQGHDSWIPARSGAALRYTDVPDPYSGETVASVRLA
jgi:hypothetical protein